MSFNYLTGQNRDTKRALRGTKLPSPLANSASNNRGLRSQRERIEILPLEIEALYVTARFLSNFPDILYDGEQKSVYLAALRKLTVSVLSANLKKNGSFDIFLAATPCVFLRNSGLGFKVTKA